MKPSPSNPSTAGSAASSPDSGPGCRGGSSDVFLTVPDAALPAKGAEGTTSGLESGPATLPREAREASLVAALTGARNRRRRRTARNSVVVGGLGAAAAILILHHVKIPMPETGNPNINIAGALLSSTNKQPKLKPYLPVRSGTGAAQTITTSQLKPWNPPARHLAHLVRTPEGGATTKATDAELLTSTSGQPAALCRFDDGTVRLVMAPPAG